MQYKMFSYISFILQEGVSLLFFTCMNSPFWEDILDISLK